MSDLVSRATSDDSKDPSGFVLKELSQRTLSSLSECEEIQELLLKRLTKDKADVKFKALRCLKHLIIHGRAEFRQSLMRNQSEIKAAINFKAAPDPLRGDAPSKRVQEEARECLNALFNGPMGGSSAKSPDVIGRIQGFGAGSSSSSSSASDNSSSAAASYNSQSSGNSYNVSASGGRFEAFGSSENVVKHSSKIERPIGGGAAAGYTAPGSSFVPPAAVEHTGNARQRGQVGGVWASEGSAPVSLNSRNPSSQASSTSSMSISSSAASSRQPVVRSNGEYESKLIDAITPPTGVRSTPSPDEVRQFLHKCESLDKVLVMILLNARLAPGAWQTQMKSLCVMEAMLGLPAPEDMEDYLAENSAELEELELNGHNQQIKGKATKILEMIGLREPKQAQPKPAAVPQQQYHAPVQAAPIVDLISFSGDAPAQSQSESAFSFLSSDAPAPAAAASVPASSSGDFLFGDLEVKAPSTAALTQATAAINLNAESDPLAMFTQSAPAAAAPAPAPASASSSFGLDSMAFLDVSTKKVDPVTALMNSQAFKQPPKPAQNTAAAPFPGGFPGSGAPPLGMGMQMGMGMQQQNGMGMMGGMPMTHNSMGMNPQMGMAGMPGMNQMGMPPMGMPNYPMGGLSMGKGGMGMGMGMGMASAPASAAFPFPSSGGPSASLPSSGAPLNFTVPQVKSSQFDSLLPGSSAPSSSSAAPASSGFGFIGGGDKSADSFNFVNDMLASSK